MDEIRRMAPDEWQLLREIRLRVLAESPLAFGRTYAQEIDMPDSEWRERCETWACFVAIDQDEVMGIAAGTWFDAGVPSLHCMWVAPTHRGTGIGAELANQVIDWARNEPATQLVMHVADDNDRAMHFYERIGFARTGEGIYMGSRPDVFAHELAMNLDS